MGRSTSLDGTEHLITLVKPTHKKKLGWRAGGGRAELLLSYVLWNLSAPPNMIVSENIDLSKKANRRFGRFGSFSAAKYLVTKAVTKPANCAGTWFGLGANGRLDEMATPSNSFKSGKVFLTAFSYSILFAGVAGLLYLAMKGLFCKILCATERN